MDILIAVAWADMLLCAWGPPAAVALAAIFAVILAINCENHP